MNPPETTRRSPKRAEQPVGSRPRVANSDGCRMMRLLNRTQAVERGSRGRKLRVRATMIRRTRVGTVDVSFRRLEQLMSSALLTEAEREYAARLASELPAVID